MAEQPSKWPPPPLLARFEKYEARLLAADRRFQVCRHDRHKQAAVAGAVLAATILFTRPRTAQDQTLAQELRIHPLLCFVHL
jgi:hypothetical protein